jgi:predicted amidohydrolase
MLSFQNYVLICAICCIIFAHIAEGYRAAVVEFAAQRVPNVNYSYAFKLNNSLNNVKNFEPFIAKAKQQGSQIIVFPEYGVTGAGFEKKNSRFNRKEAGEFCETLPDAGKPLCTDKNSAQYPVGSALACLAKKYSIVLVSNMLTRVPCKAEAKRCKDGQKQYNTAVAFDEQGTLLAKYYKRHLYGPEKKSLDRGRSPPRDSVFKTSFGVEFGMFVCFDILFEDLPSKSIKNWAYPTEWVNWSNLVRGERSTDVQKIWSDVHSRNLLAANYGGFGKKSSGSGIWLSGKALAMFFNPTNEPMSHLLVADVI